MKLLKSLKFLGGVSFFIGLNYACFRDNTDNQDVESDSLNTGRLDSALMVNTEGPILWEYDAQGDSMIKNEIPDDISMSAIVTSFNARYDSIPLQLIRVSQDTAFLKIENSSYLTQRIGTTGANGYMSELVFSLTELPGINLIDLEFEVGDHASPGLYSREDFNRKL